MKLAENFGHELRGNRAKGFRRSDFAGQNQAQFSAANFLICMHDFDEARRLCNRQRRKRTDTPY